MGFRVHEHFRLQTLSCPPQHSRPQDAQRFVDELLFLWPSLHGSAICSILPRMVVQQDEIIAPEQRCWVRERCDYGGEGFQRWFPAVDRTKWRARPGTCQRSQKKSICSEPHQSWSLEPGSASIPGLCSKTLSTAPSTAITGPPIGEKVEYCEIGTGSHAIYQAGKELCMSMMLMQDAEEVALVPPRAGTEH